MFGGGCGWIKGLSGSKIPEVGEFNVDDVWL